MGPRFQINIEKELVKELKKPGSDKRMGVNFIARPSPTLLKNIAAIQNKLRQVEPDQYFYPAEDLHMTVVEVCSSQTQEEASRISSIILNNMSQITDGLPFARVESPQLKFYPNAGVINFETLSPSLENLRKQLRDRLAQAGVPVLPRYISNTAHVTFMRYLSAPKTQPETWDKTAENSGLAGWTMDAIWLSVGATWYGKNNRIKVHGPFRLK